MNRLTLDDVQRARAVVARHLAPTPLRRALSGGDRDLRLKLECWQPTGSFKVRGALHAMSAVIAEGSCPGIVAASAGNHALGVAFAAEALGVRVPVTLVVPETTPLAKRAKLARFPVTVEVRGRTYEESQEIALRYARESGAAYVHAFDDTRTAAGQGTVALEILEQLPAVRTVLVPVGGGGLVSGVAAVLKGAAPHVRVIAVQPDASPALRASLAEGRPLLDYASAPTVADGLAGGIGEIVWAHRDLIDDVVTVEEEAIEQAMGALLAEDQVVAEGSGAVGVAAVRRGLDAPEPMVAIVTGGNVDAGVLARVLGARR